MPLEHDLLTAAAVLTGFLLGAQYGRLSLVWSIFSKMRGWK